MSTAIQTPSPALEAAAHNAGLTLTAAEPGTDFSGAPTTRAIVTLAGTPADPARQQLLELSQAFDAADPKFAEYAGDPLHRDRVPFIRLCRMRFS